MSAALAVLALVAAPYLAIGAAIVGCALLPDRRDDR